MKQESNEGFIDAISVCNCHQEKTSNSTTSTQSSELSGEIKVSPSMLRGYLLAATGGRSSAAHATRQNQARKDDKEKAARPELISAEAMLEMSRVLAAGAKRYEDHNWKKGFNYSRVVGALLRHLFAYVSGERCDPESGFSHLSHVLCNAHFLVHYEQTKTGVNDL